MATLVHAFVTSRVDYCKALYAGPPKAITDKLQRMLIAQCCRPCDGQWRTYVVWSPSVGWTVDVPGPERVVYKLGVVMYRCLHGRASRSPIVSPPLTTTPNFWCRFSASSHSANRHLVVPACRRMAIGLFRLLVRRSGTRYLKPDTHRRRRRDETVELRRVGGVYWA